MNIYLYIKTHSISGLKYLGITRNPDPHKYSGSGTYWLAHLKKYGYNYTTEILKVCYTNDEVREHGIYYSQLWNIVESKEWANLKPELGYGDRKTPKRIHHWTPESKQKRKNTMESKSNEELSVIGKKISEALAGKPKPLRTTPVKRNSLSEDTKRKISLANKGRLMSVEQRSLRRTPKSEEHKRKIKESVTRTLAKKKEQH